MNHIKKPATTHHKKAHKSPVAHKKRSNVAHQKAPHQQMGAAQRAFTTTTAPQRKMKAAVPAFAQQPKQQKSFMSAPQATTTPAFFNNTPFVSPAVQFLQQKRNMAMLTGQYLKVLVPCDPRFPDDEVISVLNQKTGLIEPVIVAVPDISFEWVFGSPTDLHTHDVIPVVKDCIDPENPILEGMGA